MQRHFIGMCEYLVYFKEGQGVALPLLSQLSTCTNNWFACVNGYFKVALKLTFSFTEVLQTSLSAALRPCDLHVVLLVSR